MRFIVSAGYDREKNQVYFVLYDDVKNELIYYYDPDFKPYLLTNAPPKLIKSPHVIKTEKKQKYHPLLEKAVTLTKVYVDRPDFVGGERSSALKNVIAKLGYQTWEDNIKFFMCYIYDKQIQMGMPLEPEITLDECEERIIKILKECGLPPKPLYVKLLRLFEYPAPKFKFCALDIEVWNEKNRIPSRDLTPYPINAICIRDGNRKVAFVLYQGKPPKRSFEYEVRVYFDEKKMLKDFFEFFKQYKIVITFNGDDFDLPYLHNRAKLFGIKSPIIFKRNATLIQGAIHIDLYKFFSIQAIKVYAFKGKYKNEDLNSIAKALLGKEKIKVTKPISELSVDEIVEYCMNDADLTYELASMKENLVLNLILVLSRISKLPMENVSRQSISNWIKSYFYARHRELSWLIPKPEEILRYRGATTLTSATIKGKKYKGAIVIQPKAGIHFNVKVLDFASLYPSIIKVYNIGYMTVNCPHEECKKNKIEGTPHHICTRHRAMESEFIGALRDLRVKWYKKLGKTNAWYSVVEQSMKVIMNASYGVFGADTFCFYCPPVAEQVTAIGRASISATAKKAQEIGVEVIYGDTDSIFLKNPTEEQIKTLINWVKQKFNLDLEIDKEYRYVCLSSRKKNYIGIFTDGERDIKGLTGKKRHTPKIIKDYFLKVTDILDDINTEQDFMKAKQDIKKVISELIKRLKNRDWEIEDLAFHMNISKTEYTKTTPQHWKAAKLLRDAGYDIQAGEIISFVKTRDKLGVKPIQLARKEDVNIKKYIEFARSTFEQLLDAIGLSFDDILGIRKLSDFF